jgi:hypothetical protein
MKTQVLKQNGWLIAGVALLGVAVALPLAIETVRSLDSTAKPELVGTVTLTCFDREMRAQTCDVLAPSAVALRNAPSGE